MIWMNMDASEIRSAPAARRYDRRPIRSIARSGGSPRVDKLVGMNPRYRRMLIPGALVGLILIVAIAAAFRS
jgi:hypothetical protein